MRWNGRQYSLTGGGQRENGAVAVRISFWEGTRSVDQ